MRKVFGVAGTGKDGGHAVLFSDRLPGEDSLVHIPKRRWVSSGQPTIGDVLRETKWGWERVKKPTEVNS